MNSNLQTENIKADSVKTVLTDIDHFIIKVIIGVLATFVGFLVILIIYKLAIERKLIFKLSQYF